MANTNKKNTDKKSIKKKSFEDFKKKHTKVAKYKPLKHFDLGDAFYQSCGIPGPAMGYTNMLLGHSDTGKTMALIQTAIDAQRKGYLPVFIITEEKWSFSFLQRLGFDCEKTIDEDGDESWDGDFLYRSDFDTIEQVAEYINDLITFQEKGELERDLVFLWDSIGSIPCQMTFEGKGGKQHNASVLADKLGMGINNRINKSRRKEYPYLNTLVLVNQPWVELPDGYGQPKIKAKGGNAAWLSSALVFLFGNEKNAGISKISIQKNKRKVVIATRSKVSIHKNHINGQAFSDGRIIISAFGFHKYTDANDETKFKKEYPNEHLDYISQLFQEKITDVSEIEFVESDEEIEE